MTTQGTSKRRLPRVNLALSKEEKLMIEYLAFEKGMSVSQYAKSLIFAGIAIWNTESK